MRTKNEVTADLKLLQRAIIWPLQKKGYEAAISHLENMTDREFNQRLGGKGFQDLDWIGRGIEKRILGCARGKDPDIEELK